MRGAGLEVVRGNEYEGGGGFIGRFKSFKIFSSSIGLLFVWIAFGSGRLLWTLFLPPKKNEGKRSSVSKPYLSLSQRAQPEKKRGPQLELFLVTYVCM